AALGECVEPAGAQGVDQHPDLDAVAGGERDRLEHRSPAGELARQRLSEPGESRLVEIEQRPGHQFGDAPALVGDLGLADAERATAAVPSVDAASITTMSSTNPARVSGPTVSFSTPAIVAAHCLVGMITVTEHAPLVSTNRATGNSPTS